MNKIDAIAQVEMINLLLSQTNKEMMDQNSKVSKQHLIKRRATLLKEKTAALLTLRQIKEESKKSDVDGIAYVELKKLMSAMRDAEASSCNTLKEMLSEIRKIRRHLEFHIK